MGKTAEDQRTQAVQLCTAGLSRSQIADALGLGSGGQPLSRWLRDVPPPAWTRRPRAKDDLRATAVAMRSEGRSYREIQEVVGVAKSTLSLWLRDVALTEEQRLALALRSPEGASRRAQAVRAAAAQRRARIQGEARDQFTHLSESELFVAGVVAYWAEGRKNKPWRSGAGVRMMNSDPEMIRLFLRWLRLVGVTPDRIRFRLHIHESANVNDALRHWSEHVEVDAGTFLTTILKKHKPRTVRRNIGPSYHGCLCVEVRRSAELNLRIEGWCEGLATAST
ncbi:MAG: helix-turn-helix domain-containing protein [Actinomycetota bacterium]|nr:helix-turn-helix domain-containing protein [Actinomycetota bacterium]